MEKIGNLDREFAERAGQGLGALAADDFTEAMVGSGAGLREAAEAIFAACFRDPVRQTVLSGSGLRPGVALPGLLKTLERAGEASLAVQEMASRRGAVGSWYTDDGGRTGTA